jgi:hypothetical protein
LNRIYPVLRLITRSEKSGLGGIRRFSPWTVRSAEMAYDTHPKEKVTGVIGPPETAARARPTTSPPIIKRIENKSDGLIHCARKLAAASSKSGVWERFEFHGFAVSIR